METIEDLKNDISKSKNEIDRAKNEFCYELMNFIGPNMKEELEKPPKIRRLTIWQKIKNYFIRKKIEKIYKKYLIREEESAMADIASYLLNKRKD